MSIDPLIESKMHDLLDSVDIEMVRLGTRLMVEYIPRNKWKTILEDHSKEKEERVILTNYGSHSFTLPPQAKWYWSISHSYIEINTPEEYYIKGGGTNITTSTTIYTGQAGLNLIQQGIKQQGIKQQVYTKNKLKTNKYEQSKINKINKGRTRTTFK